jgi:16S rRNA (guanine527-N7)-methyltransferase
MSGAAIWPAQLGVSRETEARLEEFADLLLKWSARVNLVAPSTHGDVWQRHLLDSAQLVPLAPPKPLHWLDLGSGGGLPGIVCAIFCAERSPGTRFTLVESDRRKAAFLATCARTLGLPATVRPERIEALPPQAADVVTARALAPLTRLFAFAAPHATAGACLLFPKGARHETEIAEARAQWRFTVERVPSITDPSARILRCRLEGGI